jgi:hypothetical protein
MAFRIVGLEVAGSKVMNEEGAGRVKDRRIP